MNRLLFSTLAVLISLAVRAGTVDPVPIVETQNPRGWIIQTRSSAYRIVVDADGAVKPIYYGPASICFPVPTKPGSAITRTPPTEFLFSTGT